MMQKVNTLEQNETFAQKTSSKNAIKLLNSQSKLQPITLAINYNLSLQDALKLKF